MPRLRLAIAVTLTVATMSAPAIAAIPTTGTSERAALTAAAVTPVPGDPLTGNGSTGRTTLTATDLGSGSASGTVSDQAFALPDAAAAPTHEFEGTLALTGMATNGGFSTSKDPNGYANSAALKHLPPISVALVQNGSYLIPAARGLQYTGSSYWNVIVSPGRAWNETGDGTMTRASLPFALVERNANCVHNGVLTFLFDDDSVSQVRYQITAETCEYFQFDMWGQLPATYQPGAVSDDLAIEDAFATEVGDRLPTEPIADLTTDYPAAGVNTSAFGEGVTASAMSTYGVYYGGTDYVGGCQTRQGEYPYCGEMVLPSYSTAKTMFAGVVLMRLAQLYGAVADQFIKSYVTEANSTAWNDVTFQDTANMATGNYTSAGFETDEDGATMSQFFTDETYSSKMSTALSFPHQTAPGTTWIYHTSDTFILARAENNFLQVQAGGSQDIYQFLATQILQPLHFSPDVMATVRTDDNSTGVPFGGFGLFWTQDDVAKMAKFLNNDAGKIGTTQLLDSTMLADAMQQDPDHRGLDTSGTPVFKYQDGLWAEQFTSADNASFTSPFYVPFMSGFGGITVAMMPNGASYYYFSDNDEFSWEPAVAELNKIAPMVSGGGSGTTCGAGDLISDGGFESGTAAPWTPSAAWTTSAYVVDNRASLEPSHSGSWKAWLDGLGYAHTDTASQTVSIPSGCSSAVLQFYLHIDTAETLPNAYDTLTLDVGDGGQTTHEASWSNLDATSGFQQVSIDLTPFAGQTISLTWTGNEDYSKQTSFVIDDVSLVAS